MNCTDLLEKYYDPDSKAYHFLTNHSTLVMRKALQVSERLGDLHPDMTFVQEASMIHDIGIFLCHLPKIGCYGFYPYIAHGYLGRELMEKEGLPRHGLVCERHFGVGLTIQDIEKGPLPLPKRDMTPVSLEEKIICFADKFYSKEEHSLTYEKPVATIRQIIARYGDDKLRQFDEWLEFFREPL